MKTQKEKAKELIKKFLKSQLDILHKEFPPMGSIEKRIAIQAAIICVDECLKLANLMDGSFSFQAEIKYWNEVKEELLKLKQKPLIKKEVKILNKDKD